MDLDKQKKKNKKMQTDLLVIVRASMVILREFGEDKGWCNKNEKAHLYKKKKRAGTNKLTVYLHHQ